MVKRAKANNKRRPGAGNKRTTASRPRRNGRSNNRSGAPANLPGTVTNRVTSRVAVDGGTEHLRTIESLSAFGSGEVIAKLRLTPALCTRSNLMARAFQQYSVTKAVLRITSQSPTNVAGGYMVGFIQDPTDNISDEDAVKRVRAAHGSKTVKVWENSTCTAFVPKGRWYWTNEDQSSETRLVSPGTFYIVCTVKPPSETPLIVSMDWQMRFRMPSLEQGASSLPSGTGLVPLGIDLYLDKGYFWFTDRVGGKDEYWKPDDDWVRRFQQSDLKADDLFGGAYGLKVDTASSWSFSSLQGDVEIPVIGLWYSPSRGFCFPMLASQMSPIEEEEYVTPLKTGLVFHRDVGIYSSDSGESAEFDEVGFRMTRLRLR